MSISVACLYTGSFSIRQLYNIKEDKIHLTFACKNSLPSGFIVSSNMSCGYGFLADRTDARCMIGYWHDTVVCPSVCLSARLWRCALSLMVGVGGRQLYRLVSMS